MRLDTPTVEEYTLESPHPPELKVYLMRFALPIAALAIPLLAVSALANEPHKGEKPSEAKTEKTEEAPEAKEDKRICRRVATDMSSRRKTKVCLTKEEWREFNQGN